MGFGLTGKLGRVWVGAWGGIWVGGVAGDVVGKVSVQRYSKHPRLMLAAQINEPSSP